MAKQDNGDRTVGLVRALAWPSIALIGIIIFASPLKNLLTAGNVESVKIGSLELNLRASDLPQLRDPELAGAIAGLPELAVVSLLFARSDLMYTECRFAGDDANTFDQETVQPFYELQSRGLANVIEEESDNGDVCLNLALTDTGITAREFIIDLISAQLRSARKN